MNSPEAEHDNSSKPPSGSLAETYRAWRHFFWLLGIILAVALFYAEENWRGPRAWQNYERAMAARGDLLTASAFVPPIVLDEQNFAIAPSVAHLFKMRGTPFAARFDAASSALKASKRVSSNSWVKARTDLVAWHAAFLQPTNRSQRAEARNWETNVTVETAASNILKALGESDAIFEKLREASRRPYSRFDLPYLQDDPAAILLPHLAPLKHLCQVLQLRSSAEMALGQTNQAADDIRLMLYLANATSTEPILISQLVRMAQVQFALQSIAEGMNQWSGDQLSAFQEQLGRFDFCADTRRTLQAERTLFGGGIIEYVRRAPDKMQLVSNMGMGNTEHNLNSELVGPLMTIAPSGWFYLEKLNYSRMFADSLLPIINVSGHQINPGMSRNAERQINTLFHHSAPGLFLRHRFFCALLMPSLSRAARRTAFVQTALEEAAVACGLQRYRLANGRFPDSLDSLAPQFIARLPHDIISGQPLNYRRTQDDRYVLYSVGWNETDENGAVVLTKTGENVELEQGDWVWSPLD